MKKQRSIAEQFKSFPRAQGKVGIRFWMTTQLVV